MCSCDSRSRAFTTGAILMISGRVPMIVTMRPMDRTREYSRDAIKGRLETAQSRNHHIETEVTSDVAPLRRHDRPQRSAEHRGAPRQPRDAGAAVRGPGDRLGRSEEHTSE